MRPVRTEKRFFAVFEYESGGTRSAVILSSYVKMYRPHIFKLMRNIRYVLCQRIILREVASIHHHDG